MNTRLPIALSPIGIRPLIGFNFISQQHFIQTLLDKDVGHLALPHRKIRLLPVKPLYIKFERGCHLRSRRPFKGALFVALQPTSEVIVVNISKYYTIISKNKPPSDTKLLC